MTIARIEDVTAGLQAVGAAIGRIKSAAGKSPQDFRATGNGVADDTAALSAALNAGGVLRGAGTYRITTTVTVSASVEALGLNIVWGGPSQGVMLRIEHEGASLTGCVIDGQYVAGFGIVASAGKIEGCEVKNIRSTTGSSVGIQVIGTAGDVTVANNRVHHIHSVGDATTGNANGAARGIQVQPGGTLLQPHRITDNHVWQITGEEGDGIHLIALDAGLFRSSAATRISGNRVWDCSKRCIKTQGQDTVIENNHVRLTLAGGYSCIDSIDGANTIIRNNTVLSEIAGGRGVQMVGFTEAETRLAGGNIVGNRVETIASEPGTAINVRIIDGVEVRDNVLRHGRFMSDTSARLRVKGNTCLDMVEATSDGGFNFRSTALNCDIEGNTMSGGSPYTCVKVDAGGHRISNNRNGSDANALASAVFITAGASVVTGNINTKAAAPVIRYGGTATEAGQVLAESNVQLAS